MFSLFLTASLTFVLSVFLCNNTGFVFSSTFSSFFFLMMSLSMPCWSLGTYLGVVVGNVLPENVVSALSVGLYGMFLASIIPPARKNKIILAIVAVSMLMSLVCSLLPLLSQLSEGVRTIILTVVIAGAAAILFPVKEEEDGA